ncbi:MAG: DEAD/DEAH box helicase [Deltaproteobacteria bacterium]|nr:DEAD/DEAH box helicase [Deltaproteobacteria bacterium]
MQIFEAEYIIPLFLIIVFLLISIRVSYKAKYLGPQKIDNDAKEDGDELDKRSVILAASTGPDEVLNTQQVTTQGPEDLASIFIQNNESFSSESISDFVKPNELNEEQWQAYEMLEKSNDNILVTGKAGTGKSYLLKYFVKNTSKRVVVLAPTGLAAYNIGGQTIHSFFQLPPRHFYLDRQQDLKILRKKRGLSKLINVVDAIIIDECSMVGVDLFTFLDEFLRTITNGTKPFGGKQLILFGDLFQLPPVINERKLKEHYEREFGGVFFFHSPAWCQGNFKIIELLKIHRQSEVEFIDILNSAREGRISEDDLAVLNQRVMPFEKFEERFGAQVTERGVILTPRRDKASEHNRRELGKLSGKVQTFVATIKGRVKKNLRESDYPVDYYLLLKKGAQVMCRINDPEKRFFNGSIGIVRDFDLSSEVILVEVNGFLCPIGRYSWKKLRYVYDEENDTLKEEIEHEFIQFPLSLGWAFTIHKSQGLTLPRVYLDIPQRLFAGGQLYVGLSRCPNLENIFLSNPIRKEDCIVDPAVVKFWTSVENSIIHFNAWEDKFELAVGY